MELKTEDSPEGDSHELSSEEDEALLSAVAESFEKIEGLFDSMTMTLDSALEDMEEIKNGCSMIK
jgi:hypothetical protein